MPKLSVEGYMVRYPSKMGTMLAWNSGLALTQTGARERFKARLQNGDTWRSAYRKGARVVRVRIKEV